MIIKLKLEESSKCLRECSCKQARTVLRNAHVCNQTTIEPVPDWCMLDPLRKSLSCHLYIRTKCMCVDKLYLPTVGRTM
jgi:hypothetical protein